MKSSEDSAPQQLQCDSFKKIIMMNFFVIEKYNTKKEEESVLTFIS